jgi:Tol biopolymer transport system component
VGGTLVFVSDRGGQDALYARELPGGEDRRLTFSEEPVRDPAMAPDGTRAAFSMGGRIGIATLTGEVRYLTLGVDRRDQSPSWRPDGKALVVVSKERNAANGELHVLELDTPDGQVARVPLTQSRGLDHQSPVFSPKGDFVVCVREDHLFRISLGDGRASRLTGGFRTYRSPRFLPSGRLAALWSQEKLYGLDVMDPDGKNRETLDQGTAYYRALSPSPDGRFFAATFVFDLRFHLTVALKTRKTEEVRLLDDHGRPLGDLCRAWGHSNHSPDWGR